MTARLIMAIISTLLEEIAIVAIALWALPEIDVHLPLPVLIVLMVAWCAYSITTYRIGSRALRLKQVVGLPEMIGSKGVVISPLAPEGMVRIKGELWKAKSASVSLKTGGEVIVLGRDRLTLIVRESSPADDFEKTN